MIKLIIEKLNVNYSNQQILKNISATFHGGQMTAVIGKNGVGKTTFIKAIANQVKRSGMVSLLDDTDETIYPETDITYLPQWGSVASKLTVFEMVLLGLVKDLHWRVTEQQIASVNEVLTELNLLELSSKPFDNLSGGQKQLVSMAQSLVSKPKVLLLDEPTSALDLRHQLIVMDLAKEYTKKMGTISIFVVHDLFLASRYCDSMVLLDDMKIKVHDKPEKVLIPEVLEDIYNVKVSVEKSSLGYFNVVPVMPL
jgi:iron complex transport system ATP-binding protein